MEDVNRRYWWVAAAVWAAGIVALSSVPGQNLPSTGFDGADKLFHFAEFAVLALLLGRAWRFLPAALFVIAFGVVDEFHQSLTENREPSVYDGLADALGAVAGAALAHWLQRRRSHGDRS